MLVVCWLYGSLMLLTEDRRDTGFLLTRSSSATCSASSKVSVVMSKCMIVMKFDVSVAEVMLDQDTMSCCC